MQLIGVLLDYPPPNRRGDPDVVAIGQLGWLTGLAVPFGVGQGRAMTEPQSGLRLFKRVLERAKSPVVIQVAGSCQDIVLFAETWPKLFRERVKAVYLNAGSAEDRGELEYNVKLDPAAYAKVFSLPCAVYWLPCWQYCIDGVGHPGVNASYYRFQQGRVFEKMRPRSVNFILSMLEQRLDARWLGFIDNQTDERQRAEFGRHTRSMWCTAGFLHAAGLTVTCDGKIGKADTRAGRELFKFVPIKVSCTPSGHVTWSETSESTNRYVFKVMDVSRYEEAMTCALEEIVSWL